MHASARRADVAKSAGVSESTVSRALSNSPLISKAIKDRVQAIAKDLGYVPDVQARHFAKRKSFRIGFVVRSYRAFPPFSRAYFPTLLDGVVLGAEKYGYTVTIILDKDGETPRDLAAVVKSRQVDGLLISVVAVGDNRIEHLREDKVPFVLINDYRPDCSCVNNTPNRGMRMAFEHMHAGGHRRFALVSGDLHFRNAQERCDIFERLSREFNIEGRRVDGDFSRSSGYRAAGMLLQDAAPPSVIMASSDREAFGVLDYCREHRINVPGEVSVIGYDNLYPAQEITPALTTIVNPILEAGTLATRMLVDMIEKGFTEPIAEWLETGFIVRQSTGLCSQSLEKENAKDEDLSGFGTTVFGSGCRKE